jgi:hypothetical protein
VGYKEYPIPLGLVDKAIKSRCIQRNTIVIYIKAKTNKRNVLK